MIVFLPFRPFDSLISKKSRFNQFDYFLPNLLLANGSRFVDFVVNHVGQFPSDLGQFLRDSICKQGLFTLWFIFVYVVESFNKLNYKAWYKYMGLFSNLPSIHIHLFFFIKFLYTWDFIHSHPRTSFRFPMKSPPLRQSPTKRPCGHNITQPPHFTPFRKEREVDNNLWSHNEPSCIVEMSQCRFIDIYGTCMAGKLRVI